MPTAFFTLRTRGRIPSAAKTRPVKWNRNDGHSHGGATTDNLREENTKADTGRRDGRLTGSPGLGLAILRT